MSVHRGSCSIEQNGHEMTIAAPDRSVIHWSDFSIGKEEALKLLLPHAKASMIHRVLEKNPSKIEGSLFSNGRVFLINPNGIWVGPNAKIDTASFIASTLDLVADMGAKAKMRLVEQAAGDIRVDGEIVAREGNIVLIGNTVSQFGKIQALNGQAALLGMKECFVSLDDFEPLSEEALLDGMITFESSETSALQINAIAPQIVIGEKAFLNADGQSQGGIISIGRWNGLEADYVYTHPESSISASALKEGSGGSVIVYGKERGQVYGFMAARGGFLGSGGFIEASSSHLDFQGSVDTCAKEGKTGLFLIDPLDIQLVPAAVDTNVNGLPLGPLFTPSASPSSISETTLTNALSASNVTVQSLGGAGADAGNIYMVDDVALNPAAANTLTLLAFNDIYINAALSITTAGSFDLQAPSGDILVGNAPTVPAQARDAVISTLSGNISMTAGGNIAVDARGGFPVFVEALSGNILVSAAQDVSLFGGINPGDFAQIGSPVTFVGVVNADIQVSAGGNLNMTAGSVQDAYVQIGHGSSTGFLAGTLQGDVTINIGEDAAILAGTGQASYAVVGHHGGDSTVSLNLIGDVNADIGGFLTLSAGTLNDSADAIIGHITEGYDSSVITGSVIAQIGQTFQLSGGSSRSEACIGIIGDSFLGTVGDLTVTAPLISITANGAGISTMNPGVIADSGVVLGARINGGAGGTSLTIPDFRVRIAGDLYCGPAANNAPVLIGGAGSNNNSGDINLDVQIQGDLTLDNNPANGPQIISNFIFSGPSNPNATFYLSARNLTVNSSGNFCIIGSTGPMNIDIQQNLSLNTPAFGVAWILAGGVQDINVGNDISLTSGAFFAGQPTAAIIAQGGASTVTAGDNITIQGVTSPAGSYASGIMQQSAAPLQVIAGGDMIIGDGCIIQSIDQLALVVDNDFPTFPGIGPGRFRLQAGGIVETTLKTGIQIFTARQSQNTIQGTLISGGSPVTGFTPGPLFANIPPERWGVYYPNSFLYPNQIFTIFYKDSLQGVTPVGNAVVGELIYSLNPLDEFIEWPDEFWNLWRFVVIYDDKLKTSLSDERYWIARSKYQYLKFPRVSRAL